MSGVVTTADLCRPWKQVVKPGWRGPWPCKGTVELRNLTTMAVAGLAECSCPCHRGELVHELPRLADRTAVHPTDVLADG